MSIILNFCFIYTLSYSRFVLICILTPGSLITYLSPLLPCVFQRVISKFVFIILSSGFHLPYVSLLCAGFCERFTVQVLRRQSNIHRHLFLRQIVINIIVTIVTPPDVELRMEKVMEPYVELACSCPIHGFIIALSFNVLLVIVCSYYAFKTRMLPDNFNESRYISLCVYTTMLIWLAFLPSFFTASLAFYELILLSSALLLNASVILICLYTPRIYAIYTGKTNIVLAFKSASSAKNSNSAVYRAPGTSQLENGTDEQRTELDLTDFGNTNSNDDDDSSSGHD